METSGALTARERVLSALAHREPDRVPFDLGATGSTGIQAPAYAALRAALGLPQTEVRVVDVFQQLAHVDDDVAARLGVDARNVAPRSTSIFRLTVQDAGDYEVIYDQFGIGRKRPKDGGRYYDLCYHPLAGEIDAGTIDRFPMPDPLDPARFEGLQERARCSSGRRAQGGNHQQHLRRHHRDVRLPPRFPGLLYRPGGRPAPGGTPHGPDPGIQAGLLGTSPQHCGAVCGCGAGSRRPGRPAGVAALPAHVSKARQATTQGAVRLHPCPHRRSHLPALLWRDPAADPRPDRDRRRYIEPGAGKRDTVWIPAS